jgi:hypothetical protein
MKIRKEGEMFNVPVGYYKDCIAVIKVVNKLEIGVQYICRFICEAPLNENKSMLIFVENMSVIETDDGQVFIWSVN